MRLTTSISAFSALFPLVAGLVAGGCEAGSSSPSGLVVAVSSSQVTVSLDFLNCHAASSGTQVTFDDLPLATTSLGGQVEVFGGGSRCESATFTLNAAIDFSTVRPQSTVTVTDGGTSVHATFDQLVAPRSLTPVGSGDVTAGSRVTFQLTPSTDTPGAVEKMRWDTPRGIVAARGVVAMGAEISVDVPADVVSGDTLTFSWGQGQGVTLAKVDACTGLDRCVGQPLVVPLGGMVRVP